MLPELKSKYYLGHLKKANKAIHSRWSILGRHHVHLNRFIQNEVYKLPEGSSILDGGCGLSMWVTDDIRKKYDLKSMDCQIDSINFCRAYYRDERYFLGDLYNIPLANGSIDAVVLREVIEHIKEPERAIIEVKRILKKGGVAFFTTPNYSSPLTLLIENTFSRFFSEIKPHLDDIHPSKFKFHQFRELLSKYFTLIEYGTIDWLNTKAVAKNIF